MIVHNVSVAAGEAGSLSTRTDNDTGTVTADDSGHGISDGDRVDLYWDGGCRRGMTVGTVSGADIPIDGGNGDNLPTQDTSVTIVLPEELDLNVTGTNVNAILFYTAKHGQFVLEDDGSVEALAKEVGEAVTWIWHDGDGQDNPITGDTIEKVYLSHDDTSAATMKVGVVYDNA
jgi:hypothetical protein